MSSRGRRRHAQIGHGGRGDHGIPAGQRPACPPLPRSDTAQGDRQPDGPGRLASRGLRRDRHGPPARAHGLQGNADASRHPRRDEGTRSPVQRHDLARSHQLLRDIARRRMQNLEFAIAARSRPHGQQPDQGRGSRDRVLGGAQRVRDRREFARARVVAADDGRRLRVAQLRQVDNRQPLRHRASARRQPAGFLQAVLPARQRRAGRRRQVRREESTRIYRQIFRLSSPAQTASSRRPTRKSLLRMASVSSPCAGSATSVWSGCSITSRPPRTQSFRRSKSWATSSNPSLRGGSTRPWSNPRRPPAFPSRPPRVTIRGRSRSSPRSIPRTGRRWKKSGTS